MLPQNIKKLVINHFGAVYSRPVNDNFSAKEVNEWFQS